MIVAVALWPSSAVNVVTSRIRSAAVRRCAVAARVSRQVATRALPAAIPSGAVRQATTVRPRTVIRPTCRNEPVADAVTRVETVPRTLARRTTLSVGLGVVLPAVSRAVRIVCSPLACVLVTQASTIWPARGAAIEIYGWALLYRGRDGDALVDAHDEFDDLPAYSTAPAELADRAEHLAARGIASRPVALVTAAEDFIAGDPARNRFFPAGAYRGPVDLRRLF